MLEMQEEVERVQRERELASREQAEERLKLKFASMMGAQEAGALRLCFGEWRQDVLSSRAERAQEKLRLEMQEEVERVQRERELASREQAERNPLLKFASMMAAEE